MKKTGMMVGMALILVSAILIKTNQSNESLLVSAHEAVKEAYGDFYIPSKAISADVLESQYGVNLEDIEDYIAESALMATHVDLFIGIKVKRGSEIEVADALNRYRNMMLDTYAMDTAKRAKLEASTVSTFGNYVFFMVLGQNSDAVVSDETAFLSEAVRESRKAELALSGVFNNN
jgi:Domain of unknown function (DUF4358)